MAQRKKFNFNPADKVLSADEQNEKEKEVVNVDSEEKTEKSDSAVKRTLDKIEKTTSIPNKAFNFKLIRREKLEFNEENDYPIETVEELAESILEYGLIHNIQVLYDENKDRYIIESGEQRTRAIDLLISKYENSNDTDNDEYKRYMQNVHQFHVEGYPCNVKTQQLNDESNGDDLVEKINSHIRVIIANEIGRDKDARRTKEHIDVLNDLLSQKNALLKKNDKINVNEEIGKQLGISDRQVKNYKSISKLIPELQELFNQNNITLKDGANYAKLSEEEQRQLLKVIEDGQSKQEIAALYESISQMKKNVETQEKKIQDLEDEKKRALQLAEEAKADAKSIEARIRRQITAENNNNDELNQLQEQLNKANVKITLSEKKLQDKSKEQQEIIKELEKKLEQKKSTPIDTKFIKASIQMQDKIKAIKTTMSQLKEAFEEYKSIYKDEQDEKQPAEYEKEILDILKWN